MTILKLLNKVGANDAPIALVDAKNNERVMVWCYQIYDPQTQEDKELSEDWGDAKIVSWELINGVLTLVI